MDLDAEFRVSTLVFRKKPEADRNCCAVEEIAGQRDHAVHEVGLDEVITDIALAAGACGQRTVGHDEGGVCRLC